MDGEAYRNGWMAHARDEANVREGIITHSASNPYTMHNSAFSHAEWQRGHRDRANAAPGPYLTDILDVGMEKP